MSPHSPKILLRIQIISFLIVFREAQDLNLATAQLNQAAFNVMNPGGVRRNQDTQYLQNLYNQLNGQQQFTSSNQFVPINSGFTGTSLVANAFNPIVQQNYPNFATNNQVTSFNAPTYVPPFPSLTGGLISGMVIPSFPITSQFATENGLSPNSNLLLKNRK